MRENLDAIHKHKTQIMIWWIQVICYFSRLQSWCLLIPTRMMSQQHLLTHQFSCLHVLVLQNLSKNLVVCCILEVRTTLKIYVHNKLLDCENLGHHLSEIVFSRSINAPPQIKRISFVSICRLIQELVAENDFFYRPIMLLKVKKKCIAEITSWNKNLLSRNIFLSRAIYLN